MKSDSLHKLIQALDEGEYRYCRETLTKGESPHTEAKLKLFDLLSEMNPFDSKQIKLALSDSTIAKNLAVEKTRMFQQLLNSIRTLHAKRSEANDPFRRLAEGKVLMELSLHDEAEEVVLKGLKYATESEQLLAELALRDLLRVIYKNVSNSKQGEKKIDNEYKMETTSRKLSSLVKYTNLNDRAYDYLSRYSASNKGEAQRGMDELINHPELQDINLANSLPAQQRFYNTWNFYHASRNEQELSLAAALRVIDLWHSNPKHVSLNTAPYIGHLGSVIGKLINLKRFPEALELLKRLEKLEVKGRRNLRTKFTALEIRYQIYFMNSGKLEKTLDREQIVNDGLRKFGRSIKDGPKLTLLYNFGVTHLLLGKSKDALKCFSRIKDFGELRDRTDLQGVSRLIRLLLLESSNNTLHFGHFLRTNKRFLAKKDRAYVLEGLVYDWLHKQHKLVGRAERRASYGEFANKIQPLVAEGVIGSEEIYIWATAQQKNTNPMNVLNEMAG